MGVGFLIVSFEPSSVSFVICKPEHQKINVDHPTDIDATSGNTHTIYSIIL